MTLRLVWLLLVLLGGRHVRDHLRRIYHLWTDDRAPLLPTVNDYVPDWMSEAYR